MACGTGAREQELQRAILTTLYKIGYLIIGIKNISTLQWPWMLIGCCTASVLDDFWSNYLQLWLMPHIIGFLMFDYWCIKGASKIFMSCQILWKENLQLDYTVCETIKLEKTSKECSLLIIN